jgi:hypothetical protein
MWRRSRNLYRSPSSWYRMPNEQNPTCPGEKGHRK